LGGCWSYFCNSKNLSLTQFEVSMWKLCLRKWKKDNCHRKWGQIFLRAHNYLVRRFLLIKFGGLMYGDVNFLKRYHSLSLDLRWKSYELKSEVVKSCLWFQERTLINYKNRKVSSFKVKFWRFVLSFYRIIIHSV